MKTLILILILIILPAAQAQKKMKMHMNRMNKLEQLERLKLIDILDLDEETSIRFFARQKEFRKKMESNKKDADLLLQKMKDLIGDSNKKDELNNTIEKYLALGEKIAVQKSDFVKSLSDILSEEQIAKLLVFEMKFREDIRGMLFKMRRRPQGMFP